MRRQCSENSRFGQAAALVANPVFRRRVQRFWPLGDRVTAHLLAEIAVEYGCRVEIEHFLDSAVEHEAAIHAFGFDRWPPLPVRDGGRP